MPEPAEVMPTFLPSSSLADLIGDAVLHSEDPARPLVAVAAHDLRQYAALRDVATSGTATGPRSAEFAASASKVSPPPR